MQDSTGEVIFGDRECFVIWGGGKRGGRDTEKVGDAPAFSISVWYRWPQSCRQGAYVPIKEFPCKHPEAL